MADSPFIFEADAQNFATLVLQNSYQAPVVVDFWADWCQPCKMLMPILAKLADEYQGAFILVKVNTDDNQALAAKFGVRSLPTVKVFKDGQAVDEFMGALPESEVRKFINKHRVRPTEPHRQQALALQQAGQVDEAIQLLQQVIQHEPDFHEASLDLAAILLDKGDLDSAEALLGSLPDAGVPAEQRQRLQADLKMARLKQQSESIDTSSLEQRLKANANDLEAMLELAKVRIAQGHLEEGLGLYLKVMQKDAAFQAGAGRAGLLSTFELLGAAHPLVKKYRGKMFSSMY
ncbi:MAG: thioredoxin [Proteobacteria bacterium]|nr:MAG: thioredoxin [Pseudomonadota bacterium]